MSFGKLEPSKTFSWFRRSVLNDCEAGSFKLFYHQLFGKAATDRAANDEDIRAAVEEYFAQRDEARVVVPTENGVDTYLNDGKGNFQIKGYQSVSARNNVGSLIQIVGADQIQDLLDNLKIQKTVLGRTIFIRCKFEIFDVHRFRPVIKNEDDGKLECLEMLNNNVQRMIPG